MTEAQKGSRRAAEAASKIFDGRDPRGDHAPIMVTTEQAVATVLLALYPDPAKAAAMLNEGLLQGVEQRLSMFAAKREGK